MTDGVKLYLDLLARVLTRYGFDSGRLPVTLPAGSYPAYLFDLVRAELEPQRLSVTVDQTFDPDKREVGRDWPPDAETMSGLRRLANLRACTESVIADQVPGDLIETGVWRGGSTIYMRAILKAYGIEDRTVWVADSFQGLPPPDERFPADQRSKLHTYSRLAISEEQVRENFRRYDLLDDQVRFLPGWFEDTLADAPISSLAVLRLDGDLYSSTIVALEALYDKLSPGGYLIIDDYGAVPACAKAVEDFRGERKIIDPVETIDWTGVFWRKS